MQLRRIRYYPAAYRVVGSSVEIAAVTQTKPKFYEVRDGAGKMEIARGLDRARAIASVMLRRLD